MINQINHLEELELLHQYANFKRKVFLEEINSLVYFGNGGFPYNDVVNMPIHARRIHIKIINDRKKRENEAMEQRSNSKVLDQNSNINKVKSVARQSKEQIQENTPNNYRVPKK